MVLPKLAVARSSRGRRFCRSFCPTDLHRAARPRITLHDRSIWTLLIEANATQANRAGRICMRPTRLKTTKVGGSIPSLPT